MPALLFYLKQTIMYPSVCVGVIDMSRTFGTVRSGRARDGEGAGSIPAGVKLSAFYVLRGLRLSKAASGHLISPSNVYANIVLFQKNRNTVTGR